MKIIIIEDESLARNVIKKYLEAYPDSEIVAECKNGFEGLKAIQDYKPDLVFLDIQMPKITGFEMLEVLDYIPDIIFTTAYDQFAIKAFEYNAVDYLLKPFSRERFNTAMQRVKERRDLNQKPDETMKKVLEQVQDNVEIVERIIVKDNSKITIIPVTEIRYIEANDDYVLLYTEKGRFIKQATMKYFENHLDPEKFVRVHRTYIVSIDNIAGIELFEKDSYILELKDKTQLKISRSGMKRLKELLDI